MLIVCHATFPGEIGVISPSKSVPFAASCRRRIREARRDRVPVIHFLSSSFAARQMLDGCSAKATECVFLGSSGSLFDHGDLVRIIRNIEVERCWLTGQINAYVLSRTMLDAKELGLFIDVHPEAIRVIGSDTYRV